MMRRSRRAVGSMTAGQPGVAGARDCHHGGMSRRVRVASSVAIVAVSVAATVLAACQAAPPPHPVANRAFPSARGHAPAEVWAVGDGADGSRAARALADEIMRARPDRFLYLGDVYESGTAAEFARNYAPVYGQLASRTAPTPGNHDWPNHRRGYDRYWRTITGRPTPPWYAFRIGGWQLLSLNSEAPHGARSAQLRWLRRQLRKPGTCRLAFWHRPRYSAGFHGDQADMRPFWNALRRHATLVLSGHDHDLQRLHPRHGITLLVAGAGGHGHYEVDRDDSRLAYANDTRYGALRLRLRRGRAGIAFVTATGRLLDRSAVSCRPG
jgi:hypothetical protein